MFVLCSKISIDSIKNGQFSWSGVNDVRIKKSIGSYVDTCTIKLPTTARLSSNNTVTLQTVYTFNTGDKITVQLGYNGFLYTEFTGFIKNVGFATPVEVECEGYSYQLKRKNINKSWKTTTLLEVCEYITNGTDIKLSNAIPQLPLINYNVHNASATKVLDDLINQFKLVAYFNNDTLYVGLEETNNGNIQQVNYRLGYNTADVNNLKYQSEDDVRIKVIVKLATNHGDKEMYSIGDADGAVRTMHIKNAQLNDVKKNADDYLKQYKYSGFTGSLTGFLQPYVEPGYSCKIVDGRYEERSGTYFVYSVEVTFGMNGARRVVDLTKKLSD